jgi:hypothetical protein
MAATLLFSTTSVDAATISTQDTVVVLRVGEGSAALAGTAARAYLEEYAITFAGGAPVAATHVQTIEVPHTGAAPGTKLTIGGTAGLEGSLNFSANGQYLMFGGNDSFVGETNSGKRKIVGRLDLAGNVTLDAIYGAGTTSSGNAMRSVTSTDGNQYWFGEGGGSASSPGVAWRTWEGPPGDDGDDPGVTANILSTLNTRRVEIYNGQLYLGSAAGGIFGVATVGSGTPTSGSQTVTVLPGMPTTTGPSTVDFWFADPNTLYVADDRTNTNGGLQKWALESGTWVLKYTKNIDTTNDTFDNGLRGLTGSVGTDGTVTLFGTSTFGTAGGANFLVGISDTLANTNPANVIVNSLASSATIPGAGGAFANFRGLEDIGIVVPEPGSIALLAIGSLLLIGRRKRLG